MTSIIASNISKNTTKQGLQDFFSYCGAIRDIDLSSAGETQKATITFEKASAATTASMLSGGELDGNNLEIQLAQSAEDTAKTAAQDTADSAKKTANDVKERVIGQEDKPRAAIVAEFLAHGYVISDDITKRALDYDAQHGYSEKFKSFVLGLDRSLGEKLAKAPAAAPTDASKDATEKAPATDAGSDPSLTRQVQAQAHAVYEHPAVKSRADWAWDRLAEYYNAFVNHPRIKSFYEQTSRTVQDVHEEAKRIKEEKQKASQKQA